MVATTGVTAWGYKYENATAIEQVKADAQYGKDYMFDLQGRRVTKTGKGIYIQNGRKVAVK